MHTGRTRPPRRAGVHWSVAHVYLHVGGGSHDSLNKDDHNKVARKLERTQSTTAVSQLYLSAEVELSKGSVENKGKSK